MPLPTHNLGEVRPGKQRLKSDESEEELRTKLATKISDASSQQLELWAKAMMPLPARDRSAKKNAHGTALEDPFVYPEASLFRPASNRSFKASNNDSTRKATEKERLERLGISHHASWRERSDFNMCLADDNIDIKGAVVKNVKISDAEAVREFLEDRIRRLQQIPIKRIAKAWIRGMCPRKQTMFPYKRGQQPGALVPPWWPDEDVCRHREPDHVNRVERVALCLHLLRLRPSPSLLSKWNGNKVAPNSIHASDGWTGFLMKLAPISILEEFQDVGDEKAARRRDLLGQIYYVARLEEDFLIDGLDEDYVFSYFKAEEPKKQPQNKRARESPFRSELDASWSPSSSSLQAPRKRRNTRRNRFDAAPVVSKLEPENWADTEPDTDIDAEGSPEVVTPFTTVASSASLDQTHDSNDAVDSKPNLEKPAAFHTQPVPNTTVITDKLTSFDGNFDHYRNTFDLSRATRADCNAWDHGMDQSRTVEGPFPENVDPIVPCGMPNMPYPLPQGQQPGFTMYPTNPLPHHSFASIDSMPLWVNPSMLAIDQRAEMFEPPMMGGQSVPLMARHHMPAVFYPLQDQVCHQVHTMMPMDHEHPDPSYHWATDGPQDTTEPMQLTQSFGSDHM